MVNALDIQKFGTRRVCTECGVPLVKKAFRGESVVCVNCTASLIRRESATFNPHDVRDNKFAEKLRDLRANSEPQIVNGIKKATDLLGRSPQEIAAECVNQLLNPGAGRDDLSPEQKAALPVNHKIVTQLLKLLQEAQIIHDKQLEGQGDPFSGFTEEELRSVMLDGVMEHSRSDRNLRMQLIQVMASRCDTFFDEVAEVAAAMKSAESTELPSVRVVESPQKPQPDSQLVGASVSGLSLEDLEDL